MSHTPPSNTPQPHASTSNHFPPSPPTTLAAHASTLPTAHPPASHATPADPSGPTASPAEQPPQPTKKRRRTPPPFWALPPRRLAQRLFTRFDYLHLHAASGTLHLAYGIPRCLWIIYSTAILNEPVAPWDWELPLVAALYLVKDATAVPLTLKHRRGAMRSLFLVAGFIDVSNWVVALYLCPSFSRLPDLPDGATRTLFALMAMAAAASAINAALTTTGVVHDARKYVQAASADVVTPRRRGPIPLPGPRRMVATGAMQPRRRAPAPHLSIFDSPALHVFYAACQILPAYLLFVPACALALGGSEARGWMLDSLPTMQLLAFDAISVANLFGSTGIFAGTLQARLLISVRQTHLVLAVQMAVPLLFVASQALTCDWSTYLGLYLPYWLADPLPWAYGA